MSYCLTSLIARMSKRKSQLNLAAHARELSAQLEKAIQGTRLDDASRTELRRRVCKRLWEFERAGSKPLSSSAPDEGAGAIAQEVKRIVFFIGAGASAAFGFPVTNGILPAIWDGLHEREGETWRKWAGFRETDRRLAQEASAEELKRVLSALLPGLSSAAGVPSGASIVDVISMLEHSAIERQSPFPPAPYTDTDGKLVQPAAELSRARHLLNIAINGVLSGRKDPDLRQRLAKWIIAQSRRRRGDDEPRRVTIISTNYDTSLERPIYKIVSKWTGGIPRHIDLGLTWRDRGGDVHARQLHASLAIFKLHGSLDWLRCETCGGVTINTNQRIAPLDAWDVKREYNTCQCGGLLKSLLVTPSIVRNIRDANLLSLWNAAYEELRLADEWIFAGYSLPSEDVAIRSLLLRALHARQTKIAPSDPAPKLLRVRVVLHERDDPAPPRLTRRRLPRVFPAAMFEGRRL